MTQTLRVFSANSVAWSILYELGAIRSQTGKGVSRCWATETSAFCSPQFCPGGYLSVCFWLIVTCPLCSIFGLLEFLHLLKYMWLLSLLLSLLSPSTLQCYLNIWIRYMYQSKFLYSYRIVHELSMKIFQSNLDSEKCFMIFTSLTQKEINVLIKSSLCTFLFSWSSLCTSEFFKSSRHLLIKQLL